MPTPREPHDHDAYGTDPDAVQILEEERWPHALARDLVLDEQQADDLVQDAWLAARTSPRGSIRSVPAWVRGTMRNLSRYQARSAVHRRQREHRVARSEVGTTSVDPLERLELRQQVANAVLDLDEPTRTTVILRYYEELSSAEIARRLDQPEGTVRARLKRGLDRLRARLDREHGGDRAAWCALLLQGSDPTVGFVEPAVTSASGNTATLNGIGTIVSMKKIASAAAVTALLFAGLWTLQRGARPPHSDVPNGAPSVEIAGEVETTKSPSADAEDRSGRARRASGPEEESASPREDDTEVTGETEAPPLPEGRVAIEGTLVAVDPDGNEHTNEAAHFRLSAWTERTSEWIEIEVVDGRWSTTVPLGHQIAVYELTVDGRPANPVPQGYFDIDAERSIELRANWLAPMRLHVVDRLTGQPLDEVHVVKVRNPSLSHVTHPGVRESHRVIVEGEASPVDLEPHRVWNDFWIGAPTYAWVRIQIDPTLGGERTVELEPAGVVEVRTEGARPEPGLRFRLVDPGRSGSCSALLDISAETSGHQTIAGLRPGDYELRAELGDCFDDPIVLGKASFTVVADQHTEVELVLTATAPAPEPVEATVRLIVPDTWDDAAPSIQLDPMDASAKGRQETVFLREAKSETEDGTPRVVRWEAGPVLPGKYSVHVRPHGYQRIVNIVSDRGRADVEITLPDRATLEVSVVDAETRAPISTASVVWSVRLPDGVSGSSLDTAPLDPKTQRWRIEAPIGSVVVHVSAEGYMDHNAEHPIDEHTRPLVVELTRSFAIRVFVDDPQGHPVPNEQIEARIFGREGAEVSIRRWRMGGFWREFEVTGPGEYRLELNTIDGAAPIDPVEVTVGRDGKAEVRIQLEESR